MVSLHNIYLENTDKNTSHTDIHLDLAYTSCILVKNVRTSKLIREYEEDYKNVLFNNNPKTDSPCSLCGRTKSNGVITGKSQSDPDSEEPEHRKVYVCKSCSQLVQDKLSACLREHYPTDLTINQL